jgi:hypothetical protein
MSLREDLDRLSGECEACALSDEGSVYNHMLNCPSCQEQTLRAEEIEQQLKQMSEISTAHDIERLHRLGYELNDIVNMTERERLEAVQDMFDNLDELNERQRRAIVKTHTDLLLALPKAQREMMLRTTSVVFSSFTPERLAREDKTIKAVTWSYGPIKRRMVRKMYNGFMKM